MHKIVEINVDELIDGAYLRNINGGCMQIQVSLNRGTIDRLYEGDAVTFISDFTSFSAHVAYAWEKSQEEGRGYEVLVNVDPSRIVIDSVTIIGSSLCVFGKTK